MPSVEMILVLLGLLGALIGIVEWRIQAVHSQLKEKIDDVDKVNKAEQTNLKETAIRLEAKIDMLINLQLQANHNAENKKQ